MDIARFILVRPLASATDDSTLRLGESLAVSAPQRVSGMATHSESNVAQPIVLTVTNLPAAVGSAADMPLPKTGLVKDSSPLQRTYMLLNRVSGWLSGQHDRVSGRDVSKQMRDLSSALSLDDTSSWATGPLARADSTILFQIALLGIRKALVEAMGPDSSMKSAEMLTRLAGIAHMLSMPEAELKTLSDEDVYDMINRRPVVLTGTSGDKFAPKAQVKLIAQAKVADLHVVRSEWKAFIPSDIANIRNLMVGESFGQRDKTLSETESTTTTETQQTTSAQQESQTKLDSELSQQINTQLGITVNGHFDASASFSYPQVTASVSAGVDASLSIQKSETQASKIAREAVTQAVSRVDTMTRESRVRRELMRSEQDFKYSLKNETGQNVHAVYRWVDRIDNYQVFRYPDRFLLEFQIPEPAEYYRWRTNRSTAAANAVDAPPDWDLKIDDIKADQLVALAARYRASDLPACPDSSICVATALTLEVDKASLPPDDSKVLWNIAPASKDLSITIPPKYLAKKVFYSGEGYPVRGKWRNNERKDMEGYHSAFATVCIGKESTLYWNGGITGGGAGNKVFRATHGTETDVGVVDTIQWDDPEPPYGRALLPIGADGSLQPNPAEVDLTAGNLAGVPNTLNVSVTTLGVANCAFSFQVQCDLSPEAKAAWQLSVYDALYSAWAQWQKNYQGAQTRQQLVATNTDGSGGTERNQQIIHEELKREVISWLLDEPNFSGRQEMLPRPADKNNNETSFADFDFGKARGDAPVIQFMEQAFEWNNMTYVFYPYYWADRAKSWDTLSQITSKDPDFERFLRAGSSRVIVPALPGFETAVQNWLMYKVPFLNGKLPAPDDPLYVSIDQEIRNITSPWQGGVAGDWWQSRMSTTLLYLEKDGTLPFQNDQSQLPAEQGVVFTPKTY
jgi:hypothetical protein